MNDDLAIVVVDGSGCGLLTPRQWPPPRVPGRAPYVLGLLVSRMQSVSHSSLWFALGKVESSQRLDQRAALPPLPPRPTPLTTMAAAVVVTFRRLRRRCRHGHHGSVQVRSSPVSQSSPPPLPRHVPRPYRILASTHVRTVSQSGFAIDCITLTCREQPMALESGLVSGFG